MKGEKNQKSKAQEIENAEIGNKFTFKPTGT
jgi:hypothetical protein